MDRVGYKSERVPRNGNNMEAVLNEAEIKQLGADWYAKLDVHAPAEDYIPLQMPEGIKMLFPGDVTFEGFEGFKTWYAWAINSFFDEVHTLKQFEVAIAPERAEVKVVVNWEASMWQPPAARSQRVIMDAYQTWEVKRSPKTQKPAIATYTINSFDYAPGSAKIEGSDWTAGSKK